MAVMALFLALSACKSMQTRPEDVDVTNAISGLDLSAKAPLGVRGDSRYPVEGGDARVYPGVVTAGSPGVARSDDAPASRGGGGGYTIDFENAPVGTVAKAVITDALGMGLVVDPRVSGNISLTASGALRRDELLQAFEVSLKGINAVLVKEGGSYRIAPAGEALGAARMDRGASLQPGHGLTAIPLRFVSADNVMKLVDGFAAKSGSLRVDPVGNVLYVQGSREERRNVVETVAAFDQDFMRGQSVGIYPVANAAPDVIIAELEKITDSGPGGAMKGLVQFQPIARMNAVLVIARRMDSLRQAESWIRRLDRGDNVANVTEVYRVRYGDARNLARLLNNAFGTGNGRNGSATNGPEGLDLGSGSSSRTSLAGSTSGGTGNALANGTAPAASNGMAPTSLGSGSAAMQGSYASGDRLTALGADQEGAGDAGSRGAGAGRGNKASISADVATNSLLIIADRETLKLIQRALRQLDRPRLQVAIEATIAEVTLADGLEFGVQYYLNKITDQAAIGFTNSSISITPTPTVPGLNLLIGGQSTPQAVLHALSTKTRVKVLSNPSVVVLDNQIASIQVGDQIPLAISQTTLVGTTTGTTGSAFPVSNNIDYRNTGVILRVLPRVGANGSVSMDIEQEISNVANPAAATLTPTVSQRRLRSSVSVTSGQTVLLGGLISDRSSLDRSGVPILSQIQLIGDLFANNQTARNRTELVIFVRPRVIMDGSDVQNVAEEMRTKMLHGRSLIPVREPPPMPPVVSKDPYVPPRRPLVSKDPLPPRQAQAAKPAMASRQPARQQPLPQAPQAPGGESPFVAGKPLRDSEQSWSAMMSGGLMTGGK